MKKQDLELQKIVGLCWECKKNYKELNPRGVYCTECRLIKAKKYNEKNKGN